MFARLRRRLFMGAAWLTLVLVRFCLPRLGYRRVYGGMYRCSPVPGDRINMQRCRANARLVDRAALRRMQPPATCLHRSLALWWLLRFQGLRTQIRIGARRQEAKGWDLHAWVEHEDVIINDDPNKIATYHLMPDRLADDAAQRGQSR